MPQSQFAALAESNSESSESAAERQEQERPADTPLCGEDDDDEGFLDAHFHNHKPLRHLADRAARCAADERRRRERGAEVAVDEEEGSAKDEEGEKEEDEEVEEKEEDEEVMKGGLKRVSKKAERRLARKQTKAERKDAKQQRPTPSASAADETHGQEGGNAVAAQEGGGTVTAADAQNGTDENSELSKRDVHKASKEQAKADKKMAKEQAKATKKAGKKQVRREEAEEDALEAAAAALTIDDAEGGGDSNIMDPRFRKHILKCPSQIAPVAQHIWEIAPGFVPGMRAAARFFADETLAMLCIEEIRQAGGGFLPAVKQLANVATLPGLMGCSLGMPDIHSGYGFAVGSVAAIDLTDPEAVVSPGGVGFDINCGVRLLRTDLRAEELKEKKLARLATAIFEAVPAGVGANGAYAPSSTGDMKGALKKGMGWCLQRGLCWKEDLERTEEGGCMPDANPEAVSMRAIKRGLPQLGTLGSGNHYLELQVVDEVFDSEAASAMGLVQGNVCVMIHCGSRGLGHQLCTDYLQSMGQLMARQGISVPDRQLCCVRAASKEGQDYLQGMAAAANYAFVNRTIIAHSVREVFGRILGRDPKEDLAMQMVYDVAHNIAKREEHIDARDGQKKPTLVHRKGATRSFPPGHEALPQVYQQVGQPVLIGGSMGTCSYVLAGNDKAMELSFGSTCHGAGRRLSRSEANRTIKGTAVLGKLRAQGIEVRVASPNLVAEEADESYKDVTSVVKTCHEVGISRMVARLRPLAVIKG